MPTAIPTDVPIATAAPAATSAPVATAAQGGATTGNGTQQINLAAILALFIYLIFFGTIGYRRGARREWITLAVSLGLFFLLQQYSAAVVAFANKIGQGIAFMFGQDVSAVSRLGAWASANTTTFLFIIWLTMVVSTYLLTNHFVKKADSKSNGWAVLAGMCNGLVFATVFAPLLTTLIIPSATVTEPGTRIQLVDVVSNIWQAITDLMVRAWTLIEPNAEAFFFLGVVVLVLLAAFTLRSSAKPKAKS